MIERIKELKEQDKDNKYLGEKLQGWKEALEFVEKILEEEIKYVREEIVSLEAISHNDFNNGRIMSAQGIHNRLVKQLNKIEKLQELLK